MEAKTIKGKGGKDIVKFYCKNCSREGASFQREIKDEEFKMPFGKYKGLTLGNINATDKDYFRWLLKKESLRNPLKDKILRIMGEPIGAVSPELKYTDQAVKAIKSLIWIIKNKPEAFSKVPANILKNYSTAMKAEVFRRLVCQTSLEMSEEKKKN